MTSTTIVLGPTHAVSNALAGALDTTVRDLEAPVPSEIDGVVIVVGTDLTGGVGDRMWRTLAALQSAHSSMHGRDGRIVIVLPTIGMAGAADLVAYTTALEGIRAMAKSAARQWRSDGISVNMVAAPLQLFVPGRDASAAHLTAAAFTDDSTLIHSVVESAKFLLRHDIDHLAGATVVTDGGSVMLP
jgi:3-oxoacyl-[acyl-carrier protein] reductase